MRPANPGPDTRRLLDARQAEELGDLASALGLGHAVRVERIQPAWCSGWVEDTDVDVGHLGELYAYLQDEWGGKQYRVTVLHVDGRPLMAVKLKVAGPPRTNGRLISRDRWEAATAGEDLPTGAPAAVVAPSPALDPLQFVQFMMGESRQAAAEARTSVKEVADIHSRDVQALMQHITTTNADQAERTSLKGQIGDLTESMAAVENLRDTVASSLPEPAAVDGEPETGGMVKKAFEQFIVNSMSESVQQPGAPTPQTSRAQPPPDNGAGVPQGIPFAATRQPGN